MLTLIVSLALAADDRCAALSALDAPLTVDAGPLACGTPSLLHLRDHARALGLEDCLPPLYAAKGLAGPSAGLPLDPPHTLLPDKITRDAANNPLPQVYETENFAIKWNENRGFTLEDVEVLGDAFELAWATEIEDMGYEQPAGTQMYRFNVYIGETGPGSPSSEGAAGYFWFDNEGQPQIVLAGSLISDREFISHTAAHEFFHAVQDNLHTYDYEGQGAWYWEATAMWVEGEVYPDAAGWAVFTPFYLFLPEYPVNFFEYANGSIPSYHQYGAALWVRHLTEVTTGDPDLVRRSWVEAAPHSDPMVVLARILGVNYDETLPTAYVDHVGRAATLDYAQRDGIKQYLDEYGGWSSEYSHRPTGRIYFADGDDHEAEEDLPRTYGANYWQLDGMPAAVDVELEADDGGFAVVSWIKGGEHFHTPFYPDDSPMRIEGLDDADEAWIAVAFDNGPIDNGDRYTYTLSVDEAGPADPDPTDTDGVKAKACGCDDTGSAMLGIPALIAAVAMRRRRA